MEHISSPIVVEAIAGRAACKLAIEHHLAPVLLELDYLQLVRASKEVEIDESDFGDVVEDIKICLLVLPYFHFVYVFRESNSLAHKVAKLAISSGFSSRWGPLPKGINGFLSHSV
ncbi:hypothetical protein ACLB2K_055699 [Fragaria x ananassa]